MKILNQSLLKLFIRLHNYSYKKITDLVTKINNGQHPKHSIINYHQFFVDNVAEDDTVVDLGCGTGANAYDVAKKAQRVIGIDIKQNNIDQAKQRYQRDNLSFVVGDATKYNFDNKINKVVLSNVLEHIEGRVSFLKKMHDLSDTILLRVPMLTRDWLTVYKKEHGYEYRLDPTHYIEYTLSDLKEETSLSGWVIESYSIQFGEFWGVLKKAKT
ncbi:class I SAM-dependent methyltransferase [Patescibacteria group bacterium]|nr:class I SAM-dependent methyltransferase [Patescibacteria group bacterium]MBU1889970.1 class I SAM-dependent methyltransferase [Patescibacteria group bacterium]